jgi:hypothetical protein
MLTGHVVFRGSPAEVMYQHQHAPLPLEQLEGFPQPVVTFLEVLLEKDPARRFQNPAELLKAMATITGAIDARDARRRATRQSRQKTPSRASRVGTRRRRARLGPQKISVARLPITGSDVFGREEDIAFLDDAWANQHVNIVTILAWAGVGKSTLVNHWLRRLAADHYRSAEVVFGWSFYSRAPPETLRPQMNSLTLPSLGLEIPIRGSERRGRRAKDWRSSSRVSEPYWYWMAWSRSKIRLVHKKDGYVSLRYRRFCGNSLPSIRGFA